MAPRKSQRDADYVIDPGAWRVRDMPERMRPREAMERLGVENVPDDILLAVILRSGVQGVNVLDLARRLLREYGSLTALAASSIDELASKRGVGRVKAQVLMAAFQLAKRLSEETTPKRCLVRSPQDAVRLLRDRARALDKEVFWVLQLDAKNLLKGQPVEITRGLLDASLVHPREVFRDAIRSATAAIVLVHNHPSGDCVPSAEDIRITKQLIEAGKIIDIKVMDHVILGKSTDQSGKDFLSMREEGLADF
jgi:DNA repair protein RadC